MAFDPEENNHGIFRQEALDNRFSGRHHHGAFFVVDHWPLWLIYSGMAIIMLAILLACMCKVEVTGRARGVVISEDTGVDMTAFVPGVIKELKKEPGDVVRKNDVIAVISSPDLKSREYESTKLLDEMRMAEASKGAVRVRSYGEQLRQLNDRIESTRAQIENAKSSVHVAMMKLDANKTLAGMGLVSKIALAESQDAVTSARSALEGAQQALSSLLSDRAVLTSNEKAAELASADAIRNAQVHADSTGIANGETLVRAPADGIFDPITLRVGDPIQAGRLIGRILPMGSKRILVAYADEKDSAFLKPGQPVKIEWDAHPYTEWGPGAGKILSVGGGQASPDEVQDNLGAQAPKGAVVRLAIEITAMPRGVHGEPRFGSMASARYVTRRRRPISILFAPIRKWMD